jgi:hypothetical protein
MTSSNFLNSGQKNYRIRKTLLSDGLNLERMARKSYLKILLSFLKDSSLSRQTTMTETAIDVTARTLLTIKMLESLTICTQTIPPVVMDFTLFKVFPMKVFIDRSTKTMDTPKAASTPTNYSTNRASTPIKPS